MSDSTSEKIEERQEKLAFYFNEAKDNFTEVVKKNPASNLKELIKIVKEERNKPEIVVEEKAPEIKQI